MKWLQSGQNNCPQCRKGFRKHQIIKLYFSESESENSLVKELEETAQNLQAEAKTLQEAANKSKSLELVARYEMEEQNLKFQEERLKLTNEFKSLELTVDQLEEEKCLQHQN